MRRKWVLVSTRGTVNHTLEFYGAIKRGKVSSTKKDSPRKRNKTSKKTGCTAKLKLQYVKNWFKQITSVVIEQARLDHNHKFLTPKETQHMSSHKEKEPVLLEYIDELHKSEVPPQCVKNIMREMHGGDENVPITTCDLKNRWVVVLLSCI